jgi:hypothetical protein
MKRPLLLQELAHVLSDNAVKFSERVRRRTGIATTLREAIRLGSVRTENAEGDRKTLKDSHP